MAGIASPVLKLSERFMAREIIGPSGEATVVNLLTECAFKLPFMFTLMPRLLLLLFLNHKTSF